MCKILSKLYDIINTAEKKEEKIEQKKAEKNGIIENDINLGINLSEKKISSISSPKSPKSKISDNEFDYPDSLIDIIEEENRNTDENVSENIKLNNSSGKKNKIDLNEMKKDIKFLNNKRKNGFEDLVNNLKSKVNPIKIEDDLQINFNPNELKFEK